MSRQLIFPMVFYVFYMWALAVAMFRTRIGAVRKDEVNFKYFKALSGETPPEKVVNIARHYDNQFQVPILFLIGSCLHMVVGQVDSLTVALAWLFILTRFVHSYIHLGSNNITRRVKAFAAGWLVMLLFWGQLAYFAF